MPLWGESTSNKKYTSGKSSSASAGVSSSHGALAGNNTNAQQATYTGSNGKGSGGQSGSTAASTYVNNSGSSYANTPVTYSSAGSGSGGGGGFSNTSRASSSSLMAQQLAQQAAAQEAARQAARQEEIRQAALAAERAEQARIAEQARLAEEARIAALEAQRQEQARIKTENEAAAAARLKAQNEATAAVQNQANISAANATDAQKAKVIMAQARKSGKNDNKSNGTTSTYGATTTPTNNIAAEPYKYNIVDPNAAGAYDYNKVNRNYVFTNNNLPGYSAEPAAKFQGMSSLYGVNSPIFNNGDKVSENEFNRSSQMQNTWGTYQNYLNNGTKATLPEYSIPYTEGHFVDRNNAIENTKNYNFTAGNYNAVPSASPFYDPNYVSEDLKKVLDDVMKEGVNANTGVNKGTGTGGGGVTKTTTPTTNTQNNKQLTVDGELDNDLENPEDPDYAGMDKLVNEGEGLTSEDGSTYDQDTKDTNRYYSMSDVSNLAKTLLDASGLNTNYNSILDELQSSFINSGNTIANKIDELIASGENQVSNLANNVYKAYQNSVGSGLTSGANLGAALANAFQGAQSEVQSLNENMQSIRTSALQELYDYWKDEKDLPEKAITAMNNIYSPIYSMFGQYLYQDAASINTANASDYASDQALQAELAKINAGAYNNSSSGSSSSTTKESTAADIRNAINGIKTKEELYTILGGLGVSQDSKTYTTWEQYGKDVLAAKAKNTTTT